MSKRVVFIAGLEHSGSTLLDLLLGGHRQLVGLGELFHLLRERSGHLQNPEFLWRSDARMYFLGHAAAGVTR